MKLPAGCKLDLSGARVLQTQIPGAAEAGPGRNKYGAKPTVYNGVRYDSKAEARRAEELDALADLGLRWVGQPRFRLGCPENVYVADFLVWEPGKTPHVEDVKGHMTAKFRRDLKLWRAYGPCQLWVITGGKTEFVNGGRDFECMVRGTAGNSTLVLTED